MREQRVPSDAPTETRDKEAAAVKRHASHRDLAAAEERGKPHPHRRATKKRRVGAEFFADAVFAGASHHQTSLVRKHNGLQAALFPCVFKLISEGFSAINAAASSAVFKHPEGGGHGGPRSG